MIDQVKIRIDEETKKLLKEQVGKRIIKIGYAPYKDFSAATVIILEDCTLEIKNSAKVADAFGEEYPFLSVAPIEIKDDIAYGDAKYEYFDVDMKIEGFQTIIDCVSWEDDEKGYIDIENAVVIQGENGREIILYADDNIAEDMCIYTDRAEFEKENPIKEIWGMDKETAVYKRTYIDF